MLPPGYKAGDRVPMILEMVMESLSGLDPVGFIRYASVYKDFKTPADFAASAALSAAVACNFAI